MSLPADFNPEGLAPHIIIYDSNWQKQLEYVHEYIDPDGVRDFTLQDWKISGGVNSDAGNCQITIEDNEANHTLQIRPDWIVEVYLYLTQEELWFTGIIKEPGLTREGYGQQTIDFTAYGYAHTLTQRFIKITKAGYTDADGIVTDADGIKISELAKFCLHNDAMLIPPGDPSITTDIEDIDIILGSFTKENQSQAIVLAELANIAGAVYGVTPNLQLYFRSLNTNSGKTITNDKLENYTQENLYIIRNKRYSIRDSATRKAYTNLIGLDITIQTPIIADNGGTIRFTPAKDFTGFSLNSFPGEIKGAQIFMSDRVDGQQDHHIIEWRVTDDDWYDTIIASGTITDTTLDALPDTGGWVDLGDIPDASQRTLWLNNRYSSWYIYTASGAGRIRQYNDGESEQRVTGHDLRIRSTQETQTTLKAVNTTLKKTHRDSEVMEYLAEKPEGETATTLFEGLLNQAAKIRRIFSPVITSVNNSPPPLGKRMRFIDKQNGIDFKPVLIGYDISGNEKSKLVATNMEMELVELV